VGISFSTTDVSAEWAKEKNFPYELWADTDKTLALYYGAVSSSEQKTTSRVTKILDEKGNLILEYNDVSFQRNPQDVLEDCKQLFPQK